MKPVPSIIRLSTISIFGLLLLIAGPASALRCYSCHGTWRVDGEGPGEPGNPAGCGQGLQSPDSIPTVNCTGSCYKMYNQHGDGDDTMETWTRGCQVDACEELGSTEPRSGGRFIRCCRDADLCNAGRPQTASFDALCILLTTMYVARIIL